MKKYLLLIIIVASAAFTSNAQTGVLIKANPIPADAPDATAALDIQSITKGFLVPRMTAAQRGAIASPATGLLVFQTDGGPTGIGFWYYDGSTWRTISSSGLTAGNDIDVTGSTIDIEPQLDYVTDIIPTLSDLVLGAGGLERGRILNTGPTGASLRIGSPSTLTGSIVFANATNGNLVTIQSGTTTTSYPIVLPAAQATAAGQALLNDGSGNLTWGTVSSTGSTLNSGQFWLGNGSNVATPVSMSGDVLMNNAGLTTIQDNAVDGSDLSLTGEANGNIMQFNGTDWVPVAAGSTLTAGAGINITTNTISLANGTAAGQTYVTGNSPFTPTLVTMSGDATISTAGVLDLTNNAVETAEIQDDAVTFAKMQNITGPAVIGKPATGAGDPTTITAATSGHVLRYDGTNIAFGSMPATDLTGILPPANGGTGVNNGSNTLTIPASGTAVLGTGTTNYAAYWSGTNTVAAEQFLNVTRGGMGANMTAGAVGAIPYATSTTAYGTLPAVAPGRVLTSAGTGVAPAYSATPTLGVAGSLLGTLTLAGNTSGTVTISPAATAGGYTLILPTSIGSANQVLANSGTPGTLTWATPFVNPMTTWGDIIFGGQTPAGTPTRLAPGTGLLMGNGTGANPSWLTGTNMQTLRFNTTSAPAASSNLLNNDVTVGIGGLTTAEVTASTAKLDVDGDDAGLGLNLRSGDNQNAQSTPATHSVQIAFGYNGTTDYRHSIRTRHNSTSGTANAIDFYLWKPGVDVAGALGSNRVFTIFNDGPNSGVELYGGLFTNSSWGTAGNVLVSGGTGTAPSWVTAASILSGSTTVSNTISGNTISTTVNSVVGTAVTIPNIYTANGTLTGARTVTQSGNAITFTGGAFSALGGTISLNASTGAANDVNIASGTTTGNVVVGNATGYVGIGGAINSSYKMTVSGKVKSTGINETSDLRLKTNFSSIDGALNKVLSMNGKYYDWRTSEFPQMNLTEGRQVGVIAQEIEKILPEVVTTGDDGYKAVEYSHIVPVLIEAIKEQQKIIDGQNSTITDLKASLENVLNRVNIIEKNADINSSKVEK